MLAYLGLGSNLGSRLGDAAATVRGAAGLLGEAAAAGGWRRSRVYRTEAVGPPQPDYANAVIEIETALAPEDLLALAARTEASFGRERGVRFGPRTLDVDVLLAGGELRSGPGLTLPHPRLGERRFVLVPLCELAPELRHPTLGLRVWELLARLPAGARVEPWDGALRGLERVG